jgi:hypothetical protein
LTGVGGGSLMHFTGITKGRASALTFSLGIALLLTAIEHSLNNRPRKILNFHSPAEVFSLLTSDLVRGVALHV